MLNPLGVPSRMNLGQVLELHLGWITPSGWDISLDPNLEAEWKKLIPSGAEGRAEHPVATPVFDGVKPEVLEGACCPPRCRTATATVWSALTAKATLFDGRTGEPYTKADFRWLHVHAEAAPPGRRQDSCSFHRPVLHDHPAAARW